MTIPEIRKALNVPKDLRICEHIYNVMEQYEKYVDVKIVHHIHHKPKEGHVYQDQTIISKGIDIFYVEDEEFISKLSK